MIEGGIAGTVNLRTRVPFDQDGRLISISIKNTYGDIAGKSTPEISGIISDRWQTGIGEIGLMLSGAYSHAVTASQGIPFDRMAIFHGVLGPGKQYHPNGIRSDSRREGKKWGSTCISRWR